LEGADKIVLNSLIRRVQNADSFKILVKSVGAKLVRKGRSRNWLLFITQEQIPKLIDEIHLSREQSWYWVAKLLAQKRQALTETEILALARIQSSITVNELMAKTDCTLSEARKVIDQLEWE
jgi:hypothetical protein